MNWYQNGKKGEYVDCKTNDCSVPVSVTKDQVTALIRVGHVNILCRNCEIRYKEYYKGDCAHCRRTAIPTDKWINEINKALEEK